MLAPPPFDSGLKFSLCPAQRGEIDEVTIKPNAQEAFQPSLPSIGPSLCHVNDKRMPSEGRTVGI
jgi:hypothetical protein